MTKTERDAIKINYIKNIKRAWTFERLTEKEKANVLEIMHTAKLYANNKAGVFDELHCIYSAFLNALNYSENPTIWRESESNFIPLF